MRSNALKLAAVAAVLAMVTGGAVAAGQSTEADSITDAPRAVDPAANPVQYSVKFVCGWLPPVPPQDDQWLKPGDYATSINIHNHTDGWVNGGRRVALWYRPGGGAPAVPKFGISIQRWRVLTIDCVDIWGMVGVPAGTFLEGMVHIGLDQQLPVAAVYTSQTHVDPLLGPDAGAGTSIDVEYVEPFLVTPG